MKYTVIKEFKGAPDGKRTLTFAVDQEIAHADLGDDLAEVALRERWIEKDKRAAAKEKAKAKAEAEAKEKAEAEAKEKAEAEAKEKAEAEANKNSELDLGNKPPK